MTYPTVALRDWSYKPKAPSNSGSILTRCLICFCPRNAPYVGGFVLIEAFEPIAGRGWFLSPHLFANAVGGRLPMPFAIIFAPKALTRPKAGPIQAGLSQSQRHRNLAGAFAAPQDQRHRIANQPVLLIDDVMTTGATLYEAAKTLHWVGSDPFRGPVLARVLRHGL